MESVALPVLCTCLFLVLAVQGEDERQVHCLGPNKPVQLENPFSDEQMKNVVAYYWFFKPKESLKEELLLSYTFTTVTVDNPRWKQYKEYGAQLDNPNLNDTGTYRASLTTLSTRTDINSEVILIIVDPPTLAEDMLVLFRKVSSETGETSLRCGALQNRGEPAVDLVLMGTDGSLMQSVYDNGYQIAILKEDVAEGTYKCKVADESPGRECISSQEEFWEAEYLLKKPKGGSSGNNVNKQCHSEVLYV
ncbi:hypothetical protein EGW08_019550, partial [Elysia chlorotica]